MGDGLGVSAKASKRRKEVAAAMGAPEAMEPACAQEVVAKLHASAPEAVAYMRKKAPGKVGRPKKKGGAKAKAKAKGKGKGKAKAGLLDSPKTPGTVVKKRPASAMSAIKPSNKFVGKTLDIPADMPPDALPQAARGRGRQSYTITDRNGTISPVGRPIKSRSLPPCFSPIPKIVFTTPNKFIVPLLSVALKGSSSVTNGGETLPAPNGSPRQVPSGSPGSKFPNSLPAVQNKCPLNFRFSKFL